MDRDNLDERIKLGNMIIDTFFYSVCTGDVNIIGDQLIDCVDKLNLPDKRCDSCDLSMSFFEYNLKQGICNICAREMVKKYKEIER